MSSRRLRVAMMTALALTMPSIVGAQVPHDLFSCLSAESPTCEEFAGPAVVTECHRIFQQYTGPLSWYPLQCVGPIVVSIENIALWDNRFPLYVEIVPLLPSPRPCQNDPGYLVFIVFGSLNICTGRWETSDEIEITSVIPLGSLYALRLRSFGSNGGYGPAIDCVRVTARPVTSAVALHTWGMIKNWYR